MGVAAWGAELFERLVVDLPGMAYRCRHDASWTLEYASDGATALLGYTPAQLVDERVVSLSALIHPADLAKVSLDVEAALAARQPFRLLYRVRTATGEEKWLSEHGRGIFADGELVALEGFLLDVTTQVRAQDAMRGASRRDAIGMLAGGVAHDLNNLVMGLRGTVRGLAGEIPAGGVAATELAMLDGIAARIAELAKKLLQLGAPRDGDASVPLDLGRFVVDLAPVLRRLAGPGVTLEVTAPQAPVIVRFEAARLEQAVVNLVLNARDALAGTGTIEVRVDKAAPGRAVLSVRDGGPGMTADVQARIFDPFFTTKASGDGTGLGLAVVLDVATQLGGTIDVDSAPGAGTRFDLALPSIDDRAGLDDAELMGREVVLLVDDEATVQLHLGRGLRRLGYTVLDATSAEVALKISDRHKGPIDALITDCRMPGMTGIELAEAFATRRPEAARILITGDTLAPPPGLFAATLAKPFAPEDLTRELRAALASRRGRAER